MHLFTRILGVAVLLALAVAAPATSPHVFAAPGIVGRVYVNDNSPGTNTIGAFDRYADGSLTAMRGSPFIAGGAGTGGGLGSQGSLQLSSDGHYLLAVDAASNQISVLKKNADGELNAVGNPVSSGGIKPVSIAVYGNLVYVANQGNVPNLAGFTLNPGGHLRPLANSTVSLPANSNPGDVLFNGTGSVLVAVLVGLHSGAQPIDGALASYTVGGDGLLTAAAGSPFTAQENGPFGSVFNPVNASQLFVTNAHAGAGAGSVSAYDVASDASLSPISGSPFTNGQSGTCWAEISHDGKYLYAISTGTSVITSYSIASDGSLSVVSSSPISNTSGLPNIGAFDARLDPSGGFLYLVEARQNAVAAFQISGGNLTELNSSPTSAPSGATPNGIVVV